MTSGDFPYLDVHVLPADSAFFHVHPWSVDQRTGEVRYPAEAFNPNAPCRFAGVLADPRRAMWYGGATLECALWETVLRTLRAVGPGGQVTMGRSLTAGRRLSKVRTRQPLSVLEITPDALRRMGADDAIRDAWMALTMTPNHEHTHAPIAELLAGAAAKGLDVHGVTWLSRQTGGPIQHPVALALFQPPCPPAELFAPDPTIAPVDLDSSLGELVIDAVLRRAELVRAEDPADEGNTEDPDTA